MAAETFIACKELRNLQDASALCDAHNASRAGTRAALILNRDGLRAVVTGGKGVYFRQVLWCDLSSPLLNVATEAVHEAIRAYHIYNPPGCKP